VQDFFAPVIVTSLRPTATSDAYSIHVTSDVTQSITGAVNLSIWTWNGALVHHSALDFTLEALGSRSIYADSLQRLTDGNLATRFFTLTLTGLTNSTRATVAADNIFFPTKVKNVALPVAALQWSTRQIDSVTAEATVSSSTVAFFIALETSVPGRFEDNGFHLVSARSKTVRFHGWESFTLADFQRELRVLCLSDTL